MPLMLIILQLVVHFSFHLCTRSDGSGMMLTVVMLLSKLSGTICRDGHGDLLQSDEMLPTSVPQIW